MMVNMTTPNVYHNISHYHDWDQTYASVRVMSLVILSVVCVLGVLGNGVVIWATVFKMKKTVSTVWYLNLAVADFLATASLPLKITQMALDHWPFGRFMCKMDGLVFYMNIVASISTLVVISVDRCVGVVCPVWARCSGHRTVRNASWVSLGIWVMALIPSLPHVTREHRSCFVISDADLVIAYFVLGFVLAFSIIVFCYSVIIYRLRNKRRTQSGRSFKIIAAVITVFFLCWIPIHIIMLVYGRYEGLMEFSETLEVMRMLGIPITLTLALANSCMNPLLYMFSHGFKELVRSRSIVKVLEKAFAEADLDLNRVDMVLSGMEGSNGLPRNHGAQWLVLSPHS